MKRLIFVAIIALLFDSCTSQKNVIGVYFDQWYDTYHSLTLNSDSTFKYISKEGLQSDTIGGIWRIDNKRVVLNSKLSLSYLQSHDIKIACDTCYKEYYISVKDLLTGKGLWANINAYKNGRVIEQKNCDFEGNVTISQMSIDSISVEFIGHKSYTFAPDSIQNVFYTVFLVDENDRRKVMENEIWRYKKGKIISPEGLSLKKTNDL